MFHLRLIKSTVLISDGHLLQVIVLCVAAVALARPQSEKDAKTITNEFDLRDDQSYDTM